jgi:predicted MPP superfamily phosphohydrolase
MGLLLLFVSISLATDIYRLLVQLSAAILRMDLSKITFAPRHTFFTALVLSVFIAAYGLFEAIDIRTERITIRTPKISEKIGKLRIVQISDVHLGLIVREARLKRILDAVKAVNPDILISTGDLVDGQIDDLSGLANMLREVNPRYGKFAITGNHEFYAGLGRSLDFTEKAGFRILRGEGLHIPGLINIAGIDDRAGDSYGLAKGIPEKTLLSMLPRETFTLLLKHRPLLDEHAIGLFDLQLSGHAHKGQIFPFTLFVKPLYPIDAGFLSLQAGSSLYVSRGSGTWGPPIRFLAPPEVTVIELVHEEGHP